MFMTGSPAIDAERAFTREARARRLANLLRTLRREPADCGQLPVYDERARARRRESRARSPGSPAHFDLRHRRAQPRLAVRPLVPAGRAGPSRWQRVWLAEHRGAVLPPISVVPVGDHYAVQDGHHRVSVARARGALTIEPSSTSGERAGAVHGSSASISSPIERLSWLALWPPPWRLLSTEMTMPSSG